MLTWLTEVIASEPICAKLSEEGCSSAKHVAQKTRMRTRKYRMTKTFLEGI